MKDNVKKFEYLDSSNIIVENTLQNVSSGDSLVLCEDHLQQEFENTFDYKVLIQGKYCQLYRVSNRKADTTNAKMRRGG